MNYFNRIGLGRVTLLALFGYLLVIAAVLLVPRVTHTEDNAAEPEFKPGIPGMRMVDVRDHKFLWYEIEQLQDWERTDRISIADYRTKVIEKTVHYLQLDGDDGEEFISVTRETISELREAFRKHPPVYERKEFSSFLRASVARMNTLLGEAPRHQLFAPESKKWLLKVAFGPNERKESKQAQADTSS